MYKFNKSHVGEHGAVLSNFEYHTPCVMIIKSAIFQTVTAKDMTVDKVKLNFITDRSNRLESVDIAYCIDGRDTQEGKLLSNLIIILDLKDSNNELGFSVKQGVAVDRIWDKDQNRFVEQQIECDFEPNLSGKRIGVIFYQNWYKNKLDDTLRFNPKIYGLFSEKGKQTGADIIANKTYGQHDVAHLMYLAIESEQISQMSKDKVVRQMELEKEKETVNDNAHYQNTHAETAMSMQTDDGISQTLLTD